jgi:hypothetical protein
MPVKKWVVVAADGSELKLVYWSNELGWTALELATVFDDDEKAMCGLPMGGRWLEVTEELK